ncbi:MAG: acyltransferase [Actinomycetes bacterium]
MKETASPERVRSSRLSIPALDGLRGIAATLVVLTHVGFVTGSYSLGGLGATLARFDIGVALFFALSGFLLTRPWVAAADGGHTPRVRTYAVRRAARILPAYWVVLLVVVLTTARGATPTAVASNATLTQVYTNDLLDGFTQTWSLCTEVAFYVLLPFIAPFVARAATHSMRRALALLGVASALALVWIALVAAQILPFDHVAALWLPGHLDWFAVGLAIAVLEPTLRDSSSRLTSRWGGVLSTPWALVALALAVFALACTPIAGPLTLTPPQPLPAVTKEVLYAIVAFLVVLAGAMAPPTTSFARALGGRVGRALGRVSYGMFLWHLLVIELLRRVLGLELFSGGLLLLAVLGLGVTFVVAEVSWRVIELPMLRRAGAHPR